MNASRIWTVGAVLLIAAILGLGWVLGVAPLLTQASAADLERAGAQNQTALQRAALEQMKVDFGRLEEIQEELRTLQASIPVDEQIDVFASSVEAAASRNGALLTSIVAAEMPYGSSPEAPVAVPATGGVIMSTPAGTVYTVAVSIVLQGDLGELFASFQELQTASRLFLATGIILDNSENPEATISGYVFLLTDRQVAATPEEAATTPLGPGTTYQVPDLQESMPEWLGGEGEAPNQVIDGDEPEPTGTPTPGATPNPTATPSG